MPNYKLNYLSLRARGEISRLIFVASGTPYTDNVFPFAEWGAEKKAFMAPFGQLPVLDIDGQRLCQSMAIASYIAGQTGLDGDSPLNAARCLMIAECAKEIMDETISIIFDSDPVKREARLKEFNTEKIPRKFGYLEQFLENNGGQWFVSDKLTWADLAVIDIIKFVENESHPIPWGALPKLKSHRKRIEGIPAIASYIASRPTYKR